MGQIRYGKRKNIILWLLIVGGILMLIQKMIE